MPSASIYGREQMLAAFFAPDLFDAPEVVYLALCLVAPTAGDTGDTLSEPDDESQMLDDGTLAGYARQPIPTGSLYWGFTGSSGVANMGQVDFAPPTQDWGDIVGWALCTDPVGGRTYFIGELASPVRVVVDPDIPVQVSLGAGGLVVTQL